MIPLAEASALPSSQLAGAFDVLLTPIAAFMFVTVGTVLTTLIGSLAASWRTERRRQAAPVAQPLAARQHAA